MINLRREAKGRHCQIRIPGVCRDRVDTVVLCHQPNLALAKKDHDMLGAHGCFECHAVVDGRAESDFRESIVKLMFMEGVFRTQRLLISEGKIGVSDGVTQSAEDSFDQIVRLMLSR